MGEDVSDLIGTKLLQGWAMLNDHCPACFTPLMRNKERKMYCVKCQQWVVRENEDVKSEKFEKNEISAEVVKKSVVENGNLCPTVSEGQTSTALVLPKVDTYFSISSIERTLHVKAMELRKAIEDTRDVLQLKLLLETLDSCLKCCERVTKK